MLSLLINLALVATVVIIHYEMLNGLSRYLSNFELIRPRSRVLGSVFTALIAHIAEIWIFGIGYYFMIQDGSFGDLQGNIQGKLLDCVYFSFTTYTSLGFGDIEPSGDIRFLAGLEALTGLVLITWTASFIFIEMERLWGKGE